MQFGKTEDKTNNSLTEMSQLAYLFGRFKSEHYIGRKFNLCRTDRRHLTSEIGYNRSNLF